MKLSELQRRRIVGWLANTLSNGVVVVLALGGWSLWASVALGVLAGMCVIAASWAVGFTDPDMVLLGEAPASARWAGVALSHGVAWSAALLWHDALPAALLGLLTGRACSAAITAAWRK